MNYMKKIKRLDTFILFPLSQRRGQRRLLSGSRSDPAVLYHRLSGRTGGKKVSYDHRIRQVSGPGGR